MTRLNRTLTILLILTCAGTLAPATGTAQDDGGDRRGPVGMDVYRQLSRLPVLPQGVRTRQFSSFDRTGQNNDGFTGEYSCLRKIERGCVIAEDTGAGAIRSLWFTRNGGDVSANGNLVVRLDGETVLDVPLQDVVNGELGAPFTFLLVANADQSSGGVYLKVPMPYRESMQVLTTNRPRFYILSYRSFDSARGIERFDPDEEARGVLEMLRAYGQDDPKPEAAGEQTFSESFELAAGERVRLAELEGSSQISELRLRLPQVVGQEMPRPIQDDGRAFTGASEFIVSIVPDNEGVRLTRRLGSGVANQRARVLVDGEAVTEWEPLATTEQGWRNQTVELPASATAGKSEIRVRNEFISSDNDFNAFSYFVASNMNGEYVPTDTVDVADAESEEAHDYQIEDPSWQGARSLSYPREEPSEALAEQIAASDAILQNTRLQISFDGEKTVDAPVGEFFGSGLGEQPVRSLFFAMDTTRRGFYSTWWPMPFAESATVELVNASDEDIETGDFELEWTEDERYAEGLEPHGSMGYFHATHRRGPTVPDEDWVFLDREGRGKFVGVSHTMRSRIEGGNTRNYLEGDERVYVDGSRTPQLYGTGTEDFYQGGWYFNQGSFSLPTNGAVAHEVGRFGCRIQCDGAYRLMIGDAVPFRSDMLFSIQHGQLNNKPGRYSSTTFWYGRSDEALEVTDALDVGDAGSEEEHDYTSEQPGEVESLTSVFEGDFDTDTLTQDLRATRSPVSFTLDLDDAGEGGIVLRRLSDQEQAYQAARVFVGGEEVGVWRQPLGNPHQRWLEDHFQVPPRFVEGQDKITVRLAPLEDAPASWHAARYEVLAPRD
jgi:hypothetical protein